MPVTFWSLAVPLGVAALAYAVRPKASSIIAGAVVGLVGYYAVASTGIGIFQTSIPYGITPAPPIQLVPSQNKQAYAPLVVSGHQASGAEIF